MKHLVRYAVERAPDRVHIEARYHQRILTEVRFDKGQLTQATIDDYAGIGIRVLVDGAWGYASTSKLTKNDIEETLEESIDSARNLAKTKDEQVELAPIKPVKGVYKSCGKDTFENHDISEIIEIAKEADKIVNDYDKRISGSWTWIREPRNHRIIMNTDGTDVELYDSRPEIKIQAVASEGGNTMPGYSAFGFTGGWEIFKTKSPNEMAEKSADNAIQLLKAPLPEGGKHTVVLEPGVVGIICHEAIGHTAEADIMLSGSAVKDKIGEKVASEQVTIIDSGAQMNGGGWLVVDDAGVKTKPAILIKDGIMNSYMHSRHSAHIFEVEPTGNERAFEYDVEPIIRMRNTYLSAGDFSFGEMLEGVEFGYLCVVPRGGQADSNAEFMFNMFESYEIKAGEITTPVRNLSLTGNAFDVLKAVDAVGKDWKLDMGWGHCGKGQLARVDGGGGAIRTTALVSGKVGGG